MNAVNEMGLAAVHGAANRGSDDIIELLAKRGARLDQRGQGRPHADGLGGGRVPRDEFAGGEADTIALLKRLLARRRPRVGDGHAMKPRSCRRTLVLGAVAPRLTAPHARGPATEPVDRMAAPDGLPTSALPRSGRGATGARGCRSQRHRMRRSSSSTASRVTTRGQEWRPGARGLDPANPAGTCRRLGKGRSQAAHRHDAAGGRAEAGRRSARDVRRVARGRSSIARRCAQSDPGAPALHRLNRTEYANVDSRSALARRRRQRAAAAGRLGGRLRQHRRRARRVAGADRRLRLGGGEDQPPRRRRSVASAWTASTYRVPGDSRTGRPHRRPAARHPRRHRHQAHLSARRRVRPAGRRRRRRGSGGPPAAGRRAADDLYVTLDGERVTLQGRGATRIRVTAGPHTVAAAPVVRTRSRRRRRRLPHRSAHARHHRRSRSSGRSIPPDLATRRAGGSVLSASRRRRRETALRDEDPARARRVAPIVVPSPATGPEVETLLVVLPRPAASAARSRSGIQRALARVLVDPQFLFRFEREPASVAAGAAYRVERSRARVAAVVLPLEQHSRTTSCWTRRRAAR